MDEIGKPDLVGNRRTGFRVHQRIETNRQFAFGCFRKLVEQHFRDG